jgi:hypothetical protein
MSGGTPPVSPNGYAVFTPEFDMSYQTLGMTDVNNFTVETELIIQTRG